MTTDQDRALERFARKYIGDLIKAGCAQDLIETYQEHKQSCHYVHGIIYLVAHDRLGGSKDVQDFARNLLDDWSK